MGSDGITEDEMPQCGCGAEPEEKEVKKDTLLYWSLAFILAVIILFFAASKFMESGTPENPSITYDNWHFTKIAGMWWFEWQKGSNVYQVPLRYNPLEVEGVPMKGKINTSVFNSNSYVYITFDFSNETGQNFTTLALAAGELSQNLATAIQKVPVAACINNQSETCIERPIKSCSSSGEPVIYLREGGEARISLEGSCISITGEDMEIIRAVDRLLYHWYGIIRQQPDSAS